MCVLWLLKMLCKLILQYLKRLKGEALFINHQCTAANTNKTIYLKYSYDPEGKHLDDHYDDIVIIEIPTEEV